MTDLLLLLYLDQSQLPVNYHRYATLAHLQLAFPGRQTILSDLLSDFLLSLPFATTHCGIVRNFTIQALPTTSSGIAAPSAIALFDYLGLLSSCDFVSIQVARSMPILLRITIAIFEPTTLVWIY